MNANGWDGGVGDDRHAGRLEDLKESVGGPRYKVHVSTVTC